MSEQYYDQPVDFNNHCMDAMRYSIQQYMFSQINTNKSFAVPGM